MKMTPFQDSPAVGGGGSLPRDETSRVKKYVAHVNGILAVAGDVKFGTSTPSREALS